MSILLWVVFGLIVGSIANFIDPRESQGGLLGSITLGIVGSVVGGILLVLTIATIVWCCRKKNAASYEEKDTHPVEGTANKSGEHPQGYPGTS